MLTGLAPTTYYRPLLGGLLLMLLIVGCKSKKEVVTDTTTAKEEWRTLLDSYTAIRPSYKTVSFTGNVSATIPNDDIKLSLSYKINLIKDSLIWMRFTKFGIEAARVLITRDSVFVLDRINRELLTADFQLAHKYTGLNVSFPNVEDLFMGNLFFFEGPVVPIQLNGSPKQFKSTSAGTQFLYSINGLLQRIEKLEAKNDDQKQHTVVNYGDYQSRKGVMVPGFAEINVLAPESAKVSFQHSIINYDQADISLGFTVPSNYERKRFKGK